MIIDFDMATTRLCWASSTLIVNDIRDSDTESELEKGAEARTQR